MTPVAYGYLPCLWLETNLIRKLSVMKGLKRLMKLKRALKLVSKLTG